MFVRAAAFFLALLATAAAGAGFEDPLDPAEVRAAVIDEIETRGGSATIVDAETVDAEAPDGRSVTLYLGNLLRSLQQAPVAERPARIGAFVNAMFARVPEPQAEAVRAALRPSIYADGYIAYARAELGGPIGEWTVAGDLRAAIVIDYPDRVVILTPDHQNDTDLDPAAARELAFVNLRQMLPRLVTRYEGGVGWLELDSYYENAMILLPEVWERVDALVEGRPVMATPARGQVFFASEHDEAALSEMATYADAAQTSEPGPISAGLFLWTGAGWETFRR